MECFIAWRELGKSLLSKKGVDSLLEASYQSEGLKRCNALKRIIDVAFIPGNVDWRLVGHHIGFIILAMVTSKV